MKLMPVLAVLLWVMSTNNSAANTGNVANTAKYLGLSHSGWQWLNAGEKQALVCELAHWPECLRQLNANAASQLNFSAEFAAQALGRQEAMVLPIKDVEQAGVILLAPSLVLALTELPELPELTELSLNEHDHQARKRPSQQQLSISVAGKYYPLKLTSQAQLTLWHELGHLENIALQGSILPTKLSAYQHEWLADVYTLWRSLQETGKLELAWQQYHRRNMALINDIANLSHWSAPQLLNLLSVHADSLLFNFENYSDFIKHFYPSLMQFDEAALAEYSSLLQRTFGAGAVQSLPNYMFWRQQKLALWLRPTLSELMGKQQADLWLKSQFSALK
jgi:hypothetical protein